MRFFAWFLILALLVSACDKNKKKDLKQINILPGETAEQVYEKAEKKLKRKQYEDAINHYEAVRNYFPQSPQAVEADLKVGDAYLAWKQYDQAAEAFARFRRLHPQHASADYALLKQGESYYKDAPKTIDRDLRSCESAVVIFEDFFRRYPDSSYNNEAHRMAYDCRRKLAGHEYYVGRFYFRTDHYKAAASRLEGLLRDHAGFGYDEQAAWYLGRAYTKLKAYEDADRVLKNLVEHFPDGSYHDRAARLMARNEKQKVSHEEKVPEKSVLEKTADEPQEGPQKEP